MSSSPITASSSAASSDASSPSASGTVAATAITVPLHSEGSLLLNNDSAITTSDTTLTQSVTDNLFEVQDHQLIESLSRDVLVSSGDWEQQPQINFEMSDHELTHEFAQPDLVAFDLPSQILKKSNFIRSKLANIAFIRADAVVTIRVQGTPFQQGVLFMWQQPYAEGTSPRRRIYNEHARSISTFHGVKLNMSDPSRTASLTVPYINEYQVLNPFASDTSLSRVRVSVLSRLSAATTDDERASYSVFARLTNIKLYGHSSNADGSTFAIKTHQDDAFNAEYDENGCEYLCQGGGEDEQASSKGIVSSVATTVANVADAVSGIPVLSEIAKPISWVSRAVAGVASFFGFSKVLNLNETHTYANVPAKGFTNCVGIDNSVSLSVIPDNAVKPTIATFDNNDESQISYIASRPFFMDRICWPTSANHGDMLYELPVHPCPFSHMGGYRFGLQTIFGPPVAFITSLANWWRGQIKVHLDFAKTSFHQGRLLVQYNPRGSGVQDLEEVLSYVVDLSQVGPEGIDIDFPTVTSNKWLSALSRNESSYDMKSTAGVITMSVLGRLIAAPTVSQDITIMPWVHWENFQIAEPGSAMRVVNPPSTKETVYKFPLAGYNTTIRLDDKRTTVLSTCTDVDEKYDGQDGAKVQMYKQDDTGDDFSLISFLSNNEHFYLPTFQLPHEGEFTILTSRIDDPTVINIIAINGFNEGGEKLGTLSEYISPYDGQTINVPFKFTPIVSGRFERGILSKDYAKLIAKNKTEYLIAYANNGYNRLLELPAGEYTYVGMLGATIAIVDVSAVRDSEDYVIQGYSEGDSSNMVTTMGEVVPSLRLLTRRFSIASRQESRLVHVPSINIGTSTQPTQSLLELVSWLYRFTVGGVRAKLLVHNKPDASTLIATTAISNNRYISSPLESNSALHIQDTRLNPIIEVQQPFYSPAENLVISSETFENLSTIIAFNMDGTTPLDATILMAGSDDHSFSCLVGAPAFTLLPTS
ncbi:hypothetical protein 2 [Wenling picorna-like virus 3]|uniref:hypothetical protein 2 n=1 Tax=Wenling picorna-like virus 3 TaxID=1923531 RepID=UPI00090A5921|nr:hypothetical protein 2 [Wenling picorna-like virus 3]APG78473.1 hypothetical protein 2 [Wenling picorna-like virus 3]